MIGSRLLLRFSVFAYARRVLRAGEGEGLHPTGVYCPRKAIPWTEGTACVPRTIFEVGIGWEHDLGRFHG